MKKKITLKKRKFGINNTKIENWFIPNELNFSYRIKENIVYSHKSFLKYKGNKI